MSSIPSNLARVPNMLASQIMLGSLTRTNSDILNLQMQLSSGKAVNRPSDNPIAAGTISVLDDILERREQRMRNLTHSESVLNNADAALGDATELVMEAHTIGLSQIGVGSDAETRKTQATIIDSMLNEMVNIANRKYQNVHLFGGKATANAPMINTNGYWQYTGIGDGLITDLGLGRAVPITVSGEQAFGAMSARVQGAQDLDPAMVEKTRLTDLRGARDLGISLGVVNIQVDDGTQTNFSVDLSSAHSVEDVINTLEEAIQSVDPGATVQIDPISGRALEIIPSGGVDITISDLETDAIAADFGINKTFTAGDTVGEDLQPRLTERTLVASLDTVPPDLGLIRLTNGAQTRELDLSEADTVGDIKTLVEGLGIGIRVDIDSANDRLNFVNELSGASMSIGEVGGGTTATQLGVRSFAAETLLSDFNGGNGVQILSGKVDPETGNPDPARDLDFRITLKDGTSFEVDLAGATTVQDVLDRINQTADGAGVDPAEFQATLAEDGNGIVLNDVTDPSGTTSVEALNGSFAAHDLGILGSTASATLAGEDRATVAVESVFSHLIALRDALKANDERGISIATGKLEADLDRLAQTRGEVGARTKRVADANLREEDLKLQDIGLKSQMQDLDFTEAAMRFATLQHQLQAGLQVASRVQSLSLLDFLR